MTKATNGTKATARLQARRPSPPSLGALPQRRFSRRRALGALLIALLVAVSYFPALLAGFVWDDSIFNEAMAVRESSGLWRIWFAPGEIEKEVHYWPIVYTSFWLEHKLWGFEPLGYHIVNVVLHFLNCILVWMLMVRLRVPGAWAVAAVFAVHPLHVESVAWIIERKDLLSGLFYLAAALAWMRFAESPRPGRYVQALLLFAAAMLSKSIAITLPVALLILHWWKAGRPSRPDITRLAPFFVLGFGIVAADFWHGKGAVSFDYSVIERALLAARALWVYAGNLLWPADLPVIYPRWTVRAADPIGWLSLAAAAMLVAGLWHGRNRIGLEPLVGVAYFAITLSPVLGFVDYDYMRFTFVADRYQYLAGIGLIAVLVGAAARLIRGSPGVPAIGARCLLLIALVALGARTWHQAGVYRDDITFFSHIISLNPQAREAHFNLGAALADAGRLKESLAPSIVAAERQPGFADLHANIGGVLAKLGRFEEAEMHLRQALELDPNNRVGLLNTAGMRVGQGQYVDAVALFRQTLEDDPDNIMAHAGLADGLNRIGRHRDAVAAATKAISRRPALAAVGSLHAKLGRALHLLGQLDKAESHLAQAIELDPTDPAPLVDMAAVRSTEGLSEEADEYLRRALALRPRDPRAFQDLAEALRKQGRYEEALAMYRNALDVDPDYARAHAGTGDALFHIARYQDAIDAMGRALSLTPHPNVARQLHRLKGQALQELGRIDEAATQFERAIEIDSADADALGRLAELRFGQKRYQEASRLYVTLLKMNPDDAQNVANLAASHFYLGRTEEAIRGFERALALDPSLATARAALNQLAPAGRR